MQNYSSVLGTLLRFMDRHLRWYLLAGGNISIWMSDRHLKHSIFKRKFHCVTCTIKITCFQSTHPSPQLIFVLCFFLLSLPYQAWFHYIMVEEIILQLLEVTRISWLPPTKLGLLDFSQGSANYKSQTKSSLPPVFCSAPPTKNGFYISKCLKKKKSKE